MAATKITTPRGAVVHSASRRRFVVIAENVGGGFPTSANIERRTDSIEVAREHVSRKGAFASFGEHGDMFRVIFDCAEGVFVAVRP